SALTLREAIEINNGSPLSAFTAQEQAQVMGAPAPGEANTIAFNIPSPGVQTITPTAELPFITHSVVIDGYTQPGAMPNTNGPGLGDNAVLKIELSGAMAGTSAHGLTLLSVTGSTVRGLVINRFAQNGINISGGSANKVEGNFLGTDPSGLSLLANPYPG